MADNNTTVTIEFPDLDDRLEDPDRETTAQEFALEVATERGEVAPGSTSLTPTLH